MPSKWLLWNPSYHTALLSKQSNYFLTSAIIPKTNITPWPLAANCHKHSPSLAWWPTACPWAHSLEPLKPRIWDLAMYSRACRMRALQPGGLHSQATHLGFGPEYSRAWEPPPPACVHIVSGNGFGIWQRTHLHGSLGAYAGHGLGIWQRTHLHLGLQLGHGATVSGYGLGIWQRTHVQGWLQPGELQGRATDLGSGSELTCTKAYSLGGYSLEIRNLEMAAESPAWKQYIGHPKQSTSGESLSLSWNIHKESKMPT